MEQVQGKWKLKNQNMANLCKVAKELKDRFTSFQIEHVRRVQTLIFPLTLNVISTLGFSARTTYLGF